MRRRQVVYSTKAESNELLSFLIGGGRYVYGLIRYPDGLASRAVWMSLN